MMKFPDQYRAKHPLGYAHKAGDLFGWFQVKLPSGHTAHIMACAAIDGYQWEHVSISMKHSTPDWSEMCFIKDLFWDDGDTVVQFHPPKSEYVNVANNCLHLWRFIGEMPRPPKVMV